MKWNVHRLQRILIPIFGSAPVFFFPPSRISSFECPVYFTHIKRTFKAARSRFHLRRIMTRIRTQLRAICRTYRCEHRDRGVQRALLRTLAHGKNTWCPWPIAVTFHRRYRLRIVPRRSMFTRPSSDSLSTENNRWRIIWVALKSVETYAAACRVLISLLLLSFVGLPRRFVFVQRSILEFRFAKGTKSLFLFIDISYIGGSAFCIL